LRNFGSTDIKIEPGNEFRWNCTRDYFALKQ
jgi:hypothetical protein